jgi:hypothetical protein
VSSYSVSHCDSDHIDAPDPVRALRNIQPMPTAASAAGKGLSPIDCMNERPPYVERLLMVSLAS